MIRGFKRIKDKYRKRHQRGKSIKLVEVKSLECNYNPTKRTYNPHFHILTPNTNIAEILKKEWLQLWTSKHTYHSAQFIRAVVKSLKPVKSAIQKNLGIFGIGENAAKNEVFFR